ncbi:unnamed protein product [Parascedosporium putredinis]|uniref:Uncharacterized protein n=1 Tax=Parascedosporium putredinis TaxID=1442378 RepID=A0A9P1GVQ8_9PEZI|nr:unnamed protein product [Parascedosporium putredinis]CAI7988218.1 unnamed protein product [Parascedosporium putredinis]
MDAPMDATSLETIELFESRVHRLEYTLYGEATPEHQTAEDATIAEKLEDLERRFASLVTHVPDPAQSAGLVSQMERMKALEVTQLAQAADIAELRIRSEEVIRRWYETNALTPSDFIAEMEHRVSRVERLVRRAELEEDSL